MPADDTAAGARSAPHASPWRPRLGRILAGMFFVAVAAFFVHFARNVDWAAVLEALQAYPLRTLAGAAVLAALSHLLYSSFDLVGRLQTDHRLPVSRTCAITFVSYAFNLNLGSLVGGFATRYRLYTRAGLTADTVTRILALSLLTNWLGYAFLGGMVLAASPPTLAASWAIDAVALRWIGAALVAASFAYIAACLRWRNRRFTVRGRSFELPSVRVAFWQIAVSTVNWALIASVIYVLLGQQVPYPTVLSVLLVAAVAGVVTHVPAGLGVLEAVFVAALSGALPQAEIIAALLAYRAVYYLLPLLVATVLFVLLETTASRPPGYAADRPTRRVPSYRPWRAGPGN
ncbi:MAG: lysylphosphatidylglycerol synthase domain-containing protein [Burkholderiaceae bacterium]